MDVRYFQKRPIPIKAVQWNKHGDHPEVKPGPATFKHPQLDLLIQVPIPPEHGWIYTLENIHEVTPSDWIIEGVRGEFYPCKDEIFKATYDEVQVIDAEVIDETRNDGNAERNDVPSSA